MVLKKTFLLTDLHLLLASNSADLTLLPHIEGMLPLDKHSSSENVNRLITAKVLLTSGYVYGQFGNIVTSRWSGKVFSVMLREFNVIHSRLGNTSLCSSLSSLF